MSGIHSEIPSGHVQVEVYQLQNHGNKAGVTGICGAPDLWYKATCVGKFCLGNSVHSRLIMWIFHGRHDKQSSIGGCLNMDIPIHCQFKKDGEKPGIFGYNMFSTNPKV